MHDTALLSTPVMQSACSSSSTLRGLSPCTHACCTAA